MNKTITQQPQAPTGVESPPWTILQTDPGMDDYRVYTITGADDFTAYIVVQNENTTNPAPASGWPYEAKTEYWYVPSASATPPSSLTFTWTDYLWSQGDYSSLPPKGVEYTVIQTPHWWGSSPVEGTKPNGFCSPIIPGASGVGGSFFFMLAWDLSVGALNWYVATTNASFFSPSSTFTVFGPSCTYSSPPSVTFTGGGGVPSPPSGDWASWAGDPQPATPA